MISQQKQRTYEEALETYRPFVIGVTCEKIRLRGSRPIPIKWVINLIQDKDLRFKKPVGMCSYTAFQKPKAIPCNTIPIDVRHISPMLVESTNRYSILYKNNNVKCGICNVST